MNFSKFKIAVIAPSGRVDQQKLERAIDILKVIGCQVFVGEHVFDGFDLFSGRDEHRLKDLQWAFNHPEANIIWMARGGYGLTRIVDELDFRTQLKTKKVVIGYSDVTALFLIPKISRITACHGPVLQGADENDIKSCLRLILNRESLSFNSDARNILGETSGRIVGGNLSLLVNQMGVLPDYIYRDVILLLEDIGEYDYHVDRMLRQLFRSKILKGVSGLLLGQFTDIKQGRIPYENYMSDFVADFAKLKKPLAVNLPIGHGQPNMPLLLNTEAHLKISKNDVIISYG